MQWRLFEGIPGEDVRAVLALARRSTYRRGEVVFHRHDPADSVHLVVKGRFDVRIGTPVGDTVALGIRGPGETFGELAVMTEGERSATVTALEPGETLVVRGSELRRLARRHPSVDEVLVRLLSERVAALSERLVEAYLGVRGALQLSQAGAPHQGAAPRSPRQVLDAALEVQRLTLEQYRELDRLVQAWREGAADLPSAYRTALDRRRARLDVPNR